MFSIAVPSTITLESPAEGEGDPKHFATISFTHPTDDVSKCRVSVTTADGDVHEATFNTNGSVVDRYYASAEDLAKVREDDAEIAERKREQWEADAQKDKELLTADDTTAADVSYDAPHTPPPEHNPFEAPPPSPTPTHYNVGVRPAEPFRQEGNI